MLGDSEILAVESGGENPKLLRLSANDMVSRLGYARVKWLVIAGFSHAQLAEFTANHEPVPKWHGPTRIQKDSSRLSPYFSDGFF